jgi:hypothetical protein
VATVINGVATRLDKGRALAALAQLKPGRHVFQYAGFRSTHVDLSMYLPELFGIHFWLTMNVSSCFATSFAITGSIGFHGRLPVANVSCCRSDNE